MTICSQYLNLEILLRLLPENKGGDIYKWYLYCDISEIGSS